MLLFRNHKSKSQNPKFCQQSQVFLYLLKKKNISQVFNTFHYLASLLLNKKAKVFSFLNFITSTCLPYVKTITVGTIKYIRYF